MRHLRRDFRKNFAVRVDFELQQFSAFRVRQSLVVRPVAGRRCSGFFQDHKGAGVLPGMGERHVHAGYSQGSRMCERSPTKLDPGLIPFSTDHGDLRGSHAPCEPGAQSLGHCLLRGKTGCVRLGSYRGEFAGFSLVRGKDPFQKLGRIGACQNPLDAGDLHKIDPHARYAVVQFLLPRRRPAGAAQFQKFT